MGSDAGIFVFDYERYVNEIVPAFRDLLLTGEVAPWLSELIRSCENVTEEGLPFELTLLRHTDLVRHCTYLCSDLAFGAIGEYISSKDASDAAWDMRVCKSVGCPERTGCPYHTNTQQAVPETLNWVLEIAVGTKCLDSEQFAGRSYRPSHYNPLLDRFGISEVDPGRKLLDYLGRRGFVIGYQWMGSGEGIHGWLTPDETHEFRDFLDRLPLPRYPPTRENMAAIHREFLSGQTQGVFSWDEISLSFVRAVATMAEESRRGILWGNDIVLDII